LLTATNRNQIITLWDVASGQRKLDITDHHAGVAFSAFSPGEMLATGSEDKTLFLWKLSETLIEQTQ
jgi:WD40 repeat protein